MKSGRQWLANIIVKLCGVQSWLFSCRCMPKEKLAVLAWYRCERNSWLIFDRAAPLTGFNLCLATLGMDYYQNFDVPKMCCSYKLFVLSSSIYDFTIPSIMILLSDSIPMIVQKVSLSIHRVLLNSILGPYFLSKEKKHLIPPRLVSFLLYIDWLKCFGH